MKKWFWFLVLVCLGLGFFAGCNTLPTVLSASDKATVKGAIITNTLCKAGKMSPEDCATAKLAYEMKRNLAVSRGVDPAMFPDFTFGAEK